MTDEETIDIKTIEEWQKILDEFSQHQIEIEETFMDLCHYKGERFEEICSRILEFFLNPNKKHGFNDLWFKALCKTIQRDINISQIEIKTEEYTYNSDENKRRIDLVLKTPTSVVAIENKINAPLYNKLKKYKDHINTTYHDITENNRLFYVLTAHKLSDKDKGKADTNNYTVIYYNELFENIKSSLDEYTSTGDKKYLYCMLDFMQTVKNRGKEMELNDFEKKFFAQNKKTLDVMLSKYKHLQREVSNKIEELRKKLNENPNYNNWGHNPSWNLYVIFKKDTKKQIGIVSNFEFDDDDPFGRFRIYITTWDKDSWKQYEKGIKKECCEKYPNFDFDKAVDNNPKDAPNRVYLHMPPILKGNNDKNTYQAEITKNLQICYQILEQVTNHSNKEESNN